VTAIAVTGLLVSGCHHQPGAVALDGTPRYPGDQGIATTINRNHIILDGKRTYRVSKKFASFSTVTLQSEPMRNREHQYVLLGRSGKTATWMAGVGDVIPTPTPRAYYQGVLKRVTTKRELIFRDGTVLLLRRRVPLPRLGIALTAVIDARRHDVSEWREAG